MENNFCLLHLEKETIHCFYGPPGIGKTTLCFQYMIETLNNNKKVYFIDTESGFSLERVKQINNSVDLKNLIVFKPKDFDEQQKILETLIKQTTKNNKVGLIIVDSLVMLYRLKLADMPFKINQALAEQLRILREISMNLEIPIIVTNQMYRDFDTKESKMVGGNILEYWCKMIIDMDFENGKPRLKIKKHKHKPSKKVYFQIKEKGISEKKKFNLFG